MEIILFTLIAAMLYVVADAIVKAIEKRKGKLLDNRSIIFFGIITVLALITFNLVQTLGPKIGLFQAPPAQESAVQQPES